MQVAWDYTQLAQAYLSRPDYSSDVVRACLAIASVEKDDLACDVGAGVGHLTLMLLAKGIRVIAVEPNDAMRSIGVQRTIRSSGIDWVAGTGEATGQQSGVFRLVSFGSSFNVCDQAAALKEAHRILEEDGYFMCVWNHRDLSDPLQSEIEQLIRTNIPSYDYGSRRADQSEVIRASRLFDEPIYLEGRIVHVMSKTSVLEAWRSHATLQRQAGSAFPSIVDSIESLLSLTKSEDVEVPYRTVGWISRRLSSGAR